MKASRLFKSPQKEEWQIIATYFVEIVLWIIAVKLEIDYPEQAVEIVEKWAKENPVKTYLSVLLEKLPHVSWEGKKGFQIYV